MSLTETDKYANMRLFLTRQLLQLCYCTSSYRKFSFLRTLIRLWMLCPVFRLHI